MKRFIIVMLLLASVSIGRAQSDTAAYRSALAVQNAPEKITALVAFLGSFPSSPFRGGAYNALFGLYVDQGNEERALDAASRYLSSLAPEARTGPENAIAYALAVKNIGIDSALVYAARAEAAAKADGGSALGAIQDTRAYVLYRKGDFLQAEKIQNEAIRGHDDDPEYVGHLALYQEGNGKRRLALGTMARSVYLGGGSEMQSKFTDWLSREEKDGGKREALKESIVMKTVHASVDTLSGAKALAAKSSAAAFMARMGVDLQEAAKYAQAAVGSLSKSSPVEDAVTYKQNLALVTAARGKYTDALAILRPIEDLVSPWSTDYWMALGGIYERLGRPGDAESAYMNGLTAMNPQDLRDTLETLYRKNHGSLDGLDADLRKLRASGAAIEPGRYAPDNARTGKVHLAELFTGAECGPCVASDMAFDALREYYTTGDLLILEYHVHIPGPDPMTTNDSWARYKSYKGGGTPTAVIDGRESILGGGPKFVARNRFNLYRYAIQKYEADRPGMILAVDVVRHGDSIEVAARVGEIHGRHKPVNCVIHVALVQRSADYTGANGIPRHAWVVRKLFGGAEGSPVSPAIPVETVRAGLSLGDVEAAMGELQRDPRTQPSWPGRTRNFNGWKSAPPPLDRSALSVVAWIQNAENHEVLQSAAQDVSPATGAN